MNETLRTSRALLWQGNPKWSKVQLGFGPSTIGRSGCLLTALCIAKRWLDPDDADVGDINPRRANAIGRSLSVDAFLGDRLMADRLAPRLNLKIGAVASMDHRETEEAVRAVVSQALVAGDVAILEVDRDGHLPGGDPEGDHFVVVVQQIDVNTVLALDPAGRLISMSWPALTCEAPWFGNDCVYRPRSAKLVARA